ncbi:hypothetical protein SAMN05661010_02998 [Modicisalibacter muralis]|uniref:Aspartate/glutamate racemase family protein n=1 Tax=Modicisalibacter muralis TaxID=119000 RepID=A0A1G9PDW4_9GAMM|nr:aspartate/glutamate racemase family protein [Halomonas muralis]SDL96335.1 hypothetical protein SAMN05661010_02998 [Halomonas muralis]
MMINGGNRHTETPLGVLCLDTRFAKPRGHLRNPRTFDYPVVYDVLEGVDIPRLLQAPGDDLCQLLIDRARRLEADGVKVVAGSCGFMARYQREVAQAVSIPVVLSSLTLLPWVSVLIGEGGIGVLTADDHALGHPHLEGVGWHRPATRTRIKGLQHGREFSEVILRGERDAIDVEAMTAEIRQATLELVEERDLAAVVLECTDLSAFAPVVREASGLPVFDIVQAIDLAVAAQGG